MTDHAVASLRAADRCHVVRRSWCSLPRLAALATLLATLVPSGRGAVQQAPVVSAVSSSRTVVFRDVTVIDVAQGRRLPAQTVIVAGTRIRRMGPVGAVPVPAGAQVVNARGKYLIPDLWDMHAHPATFGADTSTTGEARLVVDFLNQAGADFIKPYDLPKPLYFAMLAEAPRDAVRRPRRPRVLW